MYTTQNSLRFIAQGTQQMKKQKKILKENNKQKWNITNLWHIIIIPEYLKHFLFVPFCLYPWLPNFWPSLFAFGGWEWSGVESMFQTLGAGELQQAH